jgi:hypothetical protein
MDFENKTPNWSATGVEPPASMKARGFEAGYKPPASYFNWFWTLVSKCIAELQEKMKQVREVTEGGTGKTSVTTGSYLVGNGTGTMLEKTPAEVRDHIGAANKNEAIPIVAATSTDGVAYTATVDGMTELKNGMLLTIVPNMTSTSASITLNVNGLGAKMIRLPLSFNNVAMSMPKLDTYYTENRPITVQYDAYYLAGDGIWKTVGKQKTSAQDLYGSVPVESGGTGAETAAGARSNIGAMASKIDGITEPMLIITDAEGNIIASRTFSGDLTINGTVTATKIVGAVYM